MFFSFAVAHILTNPIKAAAVNAQYAAMQMTYFETLCQEVKMCYTCGQHVTGISTTMSSRCNEESMGLDTWFSKSEVFFLTVIHFLDGES